MQKKLFFPPRIILVIEPDLNDHESDCDCNDCSSLDFHAKRKVLEEYTYYSIVRTTEPQIRSTTLEEDGTITVGEIADLVDNFEDIRGNTSV